MNLRCYFKYISCFSKYYFPLSCSNIIISHRHLRTLRPFTIKNSVLWRTKHWRNSNRAPCAQPKVYIIPYASLKVSAYYYLDRRGRVVRLVRYPWAIEHRLWFSVWFRPENDRRVNKVPYWCRFCI